MVHIRKVEIFGFKSFGFKNTIVDFVPGLVSISGPNGSGKSNILDAVIFAMGENRPKIMRVDKLRSLIHDIEGARRGPKMARVSVHFENADRKIPVDSDAVEVTREMDGQGENSYYLNKKKTNRSHILDLLDMANAGLHQLNAVQQGTVTRISEFTPEEKRTAIENLIGLSYFDEKKAESIKLLDEADRKLEIALAKMDEIKKRIDELEEERNLMMRHDLIERELDRLNAIAAAGRLRVILEQKTTKQVDLDAANTEMAALNSEIGEVRGEIRTLEGKKSEFMAEVDAYNDAKAAIEQELSGAMREFEEANAGILAAEKHIGQIDARVPQIREEMQEIHGRRGALESEVREADAALAASNSEKDRINAALGQLNSELDTVRGQQSGVLRKKSEFDEKTRKLNSKLNESELRHSQIKSQLADVEAKMATNTERSGQYALESAKLQELHSRLSTSAKNHGASVDQIKSMLSKLAARRDKTERDIDELNLMLEKSSKAGNRYDARIRLVKGMMHEDYSTARLKENAEELGILGLVYELLSWDKGSERAILAVGSDWIKATVVRDFVTLMGLAEHVKHKGLPKLKIIPLDAIPRLKLDLPKQDGVIGLLSDRVRCEAKYSALATFLFGNVVLASSRDAAYALSKAGYKAVTLQGEFFEPNASAVIIDINSKISNLTKIISMSTSVDGLLASIILLKKYVQRKKQAQKKLEDGMRGYRERLRISEIGLADTSHTLEDLEWQMETKAKTHGQMAERMGELARSQERLGTEIAKQESYTASLVERISLVRQNYTDGELQRIAGELERLNSKKSGLEGRRTAILEEHHERSAKKASLGAQDGKEEAMLGNLQGELERLAIQREELASNAEGLAGKREERKDNLVGLRAREQELISTSGTSVGRITKYDDELRELGVRNDALGKKISQLERRSDSLSRDLGDLEGGRIQVQKTLDAFGMDDGGGDAGFDVAPLVSSLEAERRALVLNAMAPKKYVEVSDGYRSMSARKNSLEKERNSIVGFIEEIEKNKRQAFLDAFDAVDKEISGIFSKMTGGNAWLELQNEDDIFGSGISYVIQFPNKPKRESTSISGGEKTLAAIVFVLALQKLKPSPFYLFDEVDAHLDAPNSERLSKILEERSKESQFIMVSLKDSVVQKARLIYGVYPKNGVSYVVTYKDKRLPSMLQSKKETI